MSPASMSVPPIGVTATLTVVGYLPVAVSVVVVAVARVAVTGRVNATVQLAEATSAAIENHNSLSSSAEQLRFHCNCSRNSPLSQSRSVAGVWLVCVAGGRWPVCGRGRVRWSVAGVVVVVSGGLGRGRWSVVGGRWPVAVVVVVVE